MSNDYANTIDKTVALTSTRISTDVIDLVAAGADIVKGRPLYAVIFVTTASTNLTSGYTLTITVEVDSAVGLDATPTVLATSIAYTEATLTKGRTPIILALDPGRFVSTDRYLGVRYTCSTALTGVYIRTIITSNPETNY